MSKFKLNRSFVQKFLPLDNPYNALSTGKKTPKIASFPWDYATPPEEDRATAIGNLAQKFGKDRACGSADMLADRQTHIETHSHTETRTQTYSLQYFTIALAGEVIKLLTYRKTLSSRTLNNLINISFVCSFVRSFVQPSSFKTVDILQLKLMQKVKKGTQ